MAYALEAHSHTLPAAGDLSSSIYYLVEINSSGRLAVATVQGQKVIGVLQRDDAAAAARAAAYQFSGIAKVKCGGTVDEGDYLISDSSGRAITATDGGYVIGRALTPGSSGDVISVLLATASGNLNASRGFVSLPLAQARELSSNDIINTAGDAGVLSKNTTPILEAINGATDQALRIAWAASNSDVIAWQTALPPDLDGTQAVTVHFIGYMAGATDTPVLTVTAFFGVGDTNAGGNTAALSTTVAEKTVTLAAGDVPEPPNALTVTVAPGAHTTNAAYITAAWLEYVRK